jgi:rsbT co-antagonist protein RsbR
LLRAVLDNLPIALWAVDREGICSYFDGKGLSAGGLQPGQLLGSNLFELYDNQTIRDLQKTFAGEPGHSFAQAHGVDWESWLIPVREGRGEVSSVIGFSIDVSAVKRAERELQTKLDQIERQQQAIRDLSTPIIEVWEGVLTLPMIGVLDTTRAAEAMENLLSRIVETGARYAILDLTGVEVVDTKVAGHLVGLVNAIRLIGAEGIITGIKPSVAQSVVALGLDLSALATCADLRAGLKLCIQRMARAGNSLR